MEVLQHNICSLEGLKTTRSVISYATTFYRESGFGFVMKYRVLGKVRVIMEDLVARHNVHARLWRSGIVRTSQPLRRIETIENLQNSLNSAGLYVDVHSYV